MVDVGFLADLQGYYFWIMGVFAPLFAMLVVYVAWKLNERDMSLRGYRWW
jgi:hypothetical protein